jgi:uncharacterized membrane protein
MTEFFITLVKSIDLSLNTTGLVAIMLLAFWYWLIWPTQDIARLISSHEKQSQVLITTCAINTLWLINASVSAHIHVHFLGLVVLLLMFGWRMASVIALLPVLFFSTFVLKQPFDFAIYAILAVCIPLFICFLFYSLILKYLPHHLFIYLFLGAFINAFLSMLIHIMSWALWLSYSTDYDWSYLTDNYLILIPLLGFPEALLNGMAITILAVYRPHWLFDAGVTKY